MMERTYRDVTQSYFGLMMRGNHIVRFDLYAAPEAAAVVDILYTHACNMKL